VFFGTQKTDSTVKVNNLSTNPTSNLEFDYTSKSLEESTKKYIQVEQKKEKSLFDGIKDNSINLKDIQGNSNNFNNKFNNSSTLDKFNFAGFQESTTYTNSNKSNNLNLNLESNLNYNKNDLKYSFQNVDLSNKPKDLNILDSLLNDLPNSNNNTGNSTNAGNKHITNSTTAMNGLADDYYNLDFLKNNKPNNPVKKEEKNDPFMNLLNNNAGIGYDFKNFLNK